MCFGEPDKTRTKSWLGELEIERIIASETSVFQPITLALPQKGKQGKNQGAPGGTVAH
jgi:hypothetical protein